MVEAFFFPAPPPPPPRNDPVNFTNGPSYSSGDRGAGRGRGGFSGGNARGRGIWGRGRGNYVPGRVNNGSQSSGFVANGQRQNFTSPGQAGFAPNGLKRGFATAFDERERQVPRPQAAPSVPSFNADILALTSTPSKSETSSKKKSSNLNLLGLTPRNPEDDSGSDHDEEATLAQKSGPTPSNTMQVEYKGRTATLSSPAEIAAWIAERRKNYPTAARVEEARLKAEEMRKKRQAERDKAAELRRARAMEIAAKKLADFKERSAADHGTRQPLINGQDVENHDPQPDAPQPGLQPKEEQLRQRLLKAELKVNAAKEALARMEASKNGAVKDEDGIHSIAKIPGSAPLSNDHQNPAFAHVKDEPVEDSDLSSSSPSEISEDEDDWTSSSGSSTDSNCLSDDSDSSDSEADPESANAPEQLSSKSLPQSVIPAPAPPKPDPMTNDAAHPIAPAPRQLCHNFLRGQCRFGKRCRYSHERGSKTEPERASMRAEKGNGGKQAGNGKRGGHSSLAGRKGLFQVLVEKELAEEKELALAVIVRMGEKGCFEGDPTQSGT